MSKYIKLFNLTSEYQAYVSSPDMILPNVSSCKDDNSKVYYHPYNGTNVLQGTKILCKYNVTDTTSSTTLLTNTNNISSIEIDGVEQSGVVSSYTFDTTGEHTVLFTLPEGVTSIGNATFAGCSKITSVTIGTSVTAISDSAFASCSILTSITISDSVTSIGNSAFQNCLRLTSVTIGNSVTSIGNTAFAGCSGLTSVIIPDSVTSIGSGAFVNCSGLTSVTIGNSVTSIGNGAFDGCSGLTSITCNATTAPTVQSSTFQNVKTNGTLTVPTGSTGYDVWMGTDDYYLGKYNWTKIEQ